MTVQPPLRDFHRLRTSSSARAPLTVALVNNMPDGALRATERQFRSLVARAALGQDLRFQSYYLPDVPRGNPGSRHCQLYYRPIDELLQGTVDALIVTGCEPRAASLKDEPFWHGFTQLVDWARGNTRSALWSCLAAHAAVLHLDGIERHRFERKLSGVFSCKAMSDHPLLAGFPEAVRVPHSRWNTLRDGDLAACGYETLTHSERVGPDVFVKTAPSLFVFLQGHPEYEADSLGREFRRDLDRYVSGVTATVPTPPEHYFDPATSGRLAELLATLQREDGIAAACDVRSRVPPPAPTADWRSPAALFYTNWLGTVADLRRDVRSIAAE